jgi:acyl-coenzyme A thioesterase PaaI-like protein
MSNSTPKNLAMYQKTCKLPMGKLLFSKAVCLQAPYFSTISPFISELAPNYCEVQIKNRRAVHNHLGTVHAIVMCNMAELAGGLMTDVSIPTTHRWIPKGMTVEYLKKATTDLTARATPLNPNFDWSTAGEFPAEVKVFNTQNDLVFRAVIAMWVSPKKG